MPDLSCQICSVQAMGTHKLNSCRNDSKQYHREAEAAKDKVQKLQAELQPLRLKTNELQAAVDSHSQENTIVSPDRIL